MAWGCSSVMGSQNAVCKCDERCSDLNKRGSTPFGLKGAVGREHTVIYDCDCYSDDCFTSLCPAQNAFFFAFLSILFSCLPNNQMFRMFSANYANTKAYTLCIIRNLYRNARQRQTRILRHIYLLVYAQVSQFLFKVLGFKENASLCKYSEASLAECFERPLDIPVLFSHTAPHQSMSL